MNFFKKLTAAYQTAIGSTSANETLQTLEKTKAKKSKINSKPNTLPIKLQSNLKSLPGPGIDVKYATGGTDIQYSLHIKGNKSGVSEPYSNSITITRLIKCSACNQKNINCTTCNNERLLKEAQRFSLTIPENTEHNTVFIAEDFGNACLENDKCGSLIITVKVSRPIDVFKTMSITPTEAKSILAGNEYESAMYETNYERKMLCPRCQGKRYLTHKKCDTCNAKGSIVDTYTFCVNMKSALPSVITQQPANNGERSLIFNYVNEGQYEPVSNIYGDLNVKIVIESNDKFDRSRTILRFTNDEEEPDEDGKRREYDISLGTLMESWFVFGDLGSGKSSTVLRTILKPLLKLGIGGIFMCVKKEEAADLIKQFKAHGREDDIIHITLNGPYVINALDYEYRATDKLTENVINMIMTLAEFGGAKQSSGSNDEWRQAAKQLLGNLVDLLALSQTEISFANINELRVSLPNSIEQARDATQMENNFAHKLYVKAFEWVSKYGDSIQKSDLKVVNDYLFTEWPNKGVDGQSGVTMMLQGMMTTFTKGRLGSLFTRWGNEAEGTISVTPDLALEGALIVVDLPVRVYEDSGVLAQGLWKLLGQKAANRRGTGGDPCIFYADECQDVFNKRDTPFYTTSRSLGIIHINATQNLPNMFDRIGNEQTVYSFLGNHNTMTFCANDCVKTNEYGSQKFGKIRKVTGTSKQRSKDHQGKPTFSTTTNTGDAPAIEPNDFQHLQTAHSTNPFAEAFFFNKTFRYDSGRTYARVTFPQIRL